MRETKIKVNSFVSSVRLQCIGEIIPIALILRWRIFYKGIKSDLMRAPEIFLRLTKILGKAILGLLLIMIIAVAIIHLPPAQLKITRMLSNYLSSKTGARVSIQSVEFSILGNVIVKDLAVWDRDQKIFSAQRIEASSDIVDLIGGDLIFDNVHLAGIEGKLIQSKEGLNIQFIMDAFKPKSPRNTGEPSPVKLTFKKTLLENVAFEFSSTVTGITVVADLGMFTSQNAEFSTSPNSIKAEHISLQHTIVDVLSTQPADDTRSSVASRSGRTIGPDLGTGIIFDIKDLELLDNDVSFHRNQVVNTAKFDPDHVTLKDIQVRLSDVIMREDSLSAALKSLSMQLAGFGLARAKTDLRMNRKQMSLSGFFLASGSNELHADVTAPYNFRSADDSVHAHADVTLRGQITPADFAYFFNDSVMNQFSPWGLTSFALQFDYTMGEGHIQKFNVITGRTQVNAEGMLYDVLDPDKIAWRDVEINASIGSDLRPVIAAVLQEKIRVPGDLNIQLGTSGNPKEMFADAKIFTEWGNVKSVANVVRRQANIDVDMDLIGEHIDLREWLGQSSLGSIDLSVHAAGIVGDGQHLAASGLVSKVEILDQAIRDISFQSTTGKTNSSVLVSIADPQYRSEIASEISFGGPLTFTNAVQWDDFSLGRLLRTDSTFKISGNTKLKLTLDESLLEGYVEGSGLSFQSQYMKYLIDTMFVHALVSPVRSEFTYFTEHANANLVSNFDIRNVDEIMRSWSKRMLKGYDTMNRPGMNRTAKLDVRLNDASFIKLLGFQVDEFSSLLITGEFDEQAGSATLQGASGKFSGYGVGMDTLYADLKSFQGNVSSQVSVDKLAYNSILVEDLDFDLSTKGDTTSMNLLLTNDTLTLLDLRTKILSTDTGRLVYPDKLLAFDNSYSIDPRNPVYIREESVSFNDFRIARNEMQINLNGDLNDWDASFRNLDVTPFNFLLSRDTAIISKGHLSGDISYSRDDQKLNLKANIDSLRLYNSNPLTVSAALLSEGDEMPFEFLLTNETNTIDLKGRYFPDNTAVDAVLLVDVNNPEVLRFLVTGVFDELKGSVKGRTTISGPIQKPALKGSLRFRDMGLTTANPRIFINVKDDSIVLENTAMYFNNFTIYDRELHPMTVTGNINLQDYRSLAYDLQISSGEFTLFHNPDSTSERLRGLLVIDSDIKLKGSDRDTNIDARLGIKGDTRLTVVTSAGDIGLTTAEGIIDFIDPIKMLDSTALVSGNYYDSLIASLPEFNLHSTVTIEDDATFRVIINEQSGDYIEASGRADLDLEYDRTGNLNLSGNYTVNKGLYRLSFYDLVKRNFELVPGSSISWSGSPENGNLNIRARHTVQSNSIGLIGHEIGENEKSIYKRSLDYEVGISIGGTIQRPIVSFLLDLPQDDKVNYPVLANKLDRMRQPEYQSELNKQVFGLLVLGGFLPEASTANVSSNLVATTALSNSVNALLASQLNRFASQHIKGVTIDVGIQSYSDYSAPGGKTQTAMDFRVSKSLMNDRLSVEIGGDFDISQDQSGTKTGNNYRGDIAIIYDLTGNADKKLKLFNNETYDIVYQEIRNTGVSLIFIRETDRRGKKKNLIETASKDK